MLDIARLLGPQTIWLPIVARAPQARNFLDHFPVRPALPLRTDPVPADDHARQLPPLDDLSRQVLEEGVETLGYTPVAGLRRWTQAWLDLLAPIITNAPLIEAKKA
ncbi:hypothetical protein EPN42_01240 [bacterium]|nr:MAG: hypothetical protein EPN42_01240 [bacterium]